MLSSDRVGGEENAIVSQIMPQRSTEIRRCGGTLSAHLKPTVFQAHANGCAHLAQTVLLYRSCTLQGEPALERDSRFQAFGKKLVEDTCDF